MTEPRKFGELKDAETGETVVEIFCPGADEDFLSQCLRVLTFALKSKDQDSDNGGGGFGGENGYGVEFENDVFMMHQYCWCEKEECGWCYGENPNFLHKPSGLSVCWYKWIGRDNKVTGTPTIAIFEECLASIGAAPIMQTFAMMVEAEERHHKAMEVQMPAIIEAVRKMLDEEDDTPSNDSLGG